MFKLFDLGAYLSSEQQIALVVTQPASRRTNNEKVLTLDTIKLLSHIGPSVSEGLVGHKS